MPTIKITDQLGFDMDADVAPTSALLKYFKALPPLLLQHANLSEMGGATLDQPAVRSFKAGLAFGDTIPLGHTGAPELVIGADAHGSFTLIARAPGVTTLFNPDLFGNDIQIQEGACYTSIALEASASAGMHAPGGDLSFGFAGSGSVAFVNYRKFALDGGTTVARALAESIGEFVIPAHASDLASIAPSGVVTVAGSGRLKLSVAAELLTAVNPLLTVALPGPLPTPSVKAGGSVQVAASYAFAGAYQVRAERRAGDIVRLGWYRAKSTELGVTVTASEGISAGAGGGDLLGSLLHAISSDPSANRDELIKAGLDDSQIAAIQSAVAAAIQRKLELAISTEIGLLQQGDAAFQYDIDFAKAAPSSLTAVDAALRGDLTGLHAPIALPGITCVRSLWGSVREQSLTLKVNLLGIYNFISVGKLISAGAVLYEPVTGAVVISDQETATRLRSGQINFGADPDKLRHVLAETFLLTAAYRASAGTPAQISLACSHSFFELSDRTPPETMERFLQAGVGLGLLSGAEGAVPPGIDDFGRSMVYTETKYDDALTTALFLDEADQPLSGDLYERAGRDAVRLLIPEHASDAVRRRPALEDQLWAAMEDRGQANFKALFPGVDAPLLGVIIGDYSAIVWWAGAMAGAATRLAAIRGFIKTNPILSAEDPTFSRLRKSLADHLRDVTKKTAEEFGQPWGLVAMNQVAGRKAGASVIITGPKLVRVKEKEMRA